MLSRVRSILTKRSNWLSIVVFVAAIFGTLIAFLSDNPRHVLTAISIVLTLIAFEYLFLTAVVFDKFSSQLKRIEEGDSAYPVKKFSNYVDGLAKATQNAKVEVYIIGGSLSDLSAMREDLLGLSDNVRVHLLALNIEDNTVLEQYDALRSRGPGLVRDLAHLKSFRIKLILRFELLIRCQQLIFLGTI